MKIAIIGSRSIKTIDSTTLESALPGRPSMIISGGAQGVDQLAAEYALAHKIPLVEILPDYKRFGRRAPLIRNQRIVELCDVLIAFWDGKSKGTQYTIRYARITGREKYIYQLDK